MLVAGSSSATAASTAAPVKIAQPAGFWVRLVALLLDSVLLLVILTVVVFIWIATLTPTHIDPSNPARSLIESQVVQLLYLTLTLVLLTLLYFVGSMAILGATPVMRLFNLHIVNAKGGPIGFGRALLRWLFSFSAYAVMILLINIPLLFAIALFVLFGFALLDAALVAGSKTKRALHDRLAGTLVIQYLDPDKVEANAAAITAPAAPTDTMPKPEQALPGANPRAVGGTVEAGVGAVAAGAGAGIALAVASEAAAGSAPDAPAAAPLAPAPPAPVMPSQAPVPPPAFPVHQAGPAPAPQPASPAPPAMASQPTAPVPPTSAPTPTVVPPPIDPVPPQAFEAQPYVPRPVTDLPPIAYAPPPATPAAEEDREIYSPEPGSPPAPATIDPYPLPFTPAAPDIPPPAPPPHYAEEPPPA